MCTYLFYHNEKLLDKMYINELVHRNMSGRYTCAAKNSLINTYRNSSNSQNIKIKYKPMIVSTKNQTTITAPNLLDLTFSVDSFPLSNVTIFHETKTLTFLLNVSGQLSFNVSIESCLDRGIYVVEAVNDAGSDRFTFIANVKCKPMITSTKNQTTITAPDLLDLTFSVDSFPSSNVTIFHETKTLTFLPNVTGQLSFNVSIESCLDRGDYRIEVVNDVGFGSFNFMPNIKCSPIVVRHSNVTHKEFRVGDLLHLTVTFMANPTAEVQWSFVPWNQNTSLQVQTQQIQTHKESTKLVLILSDTNKFGKYILELKNELGKISKEFNIESPIVAATKTDPGTRISSRDSDSDGDRSMSPTPWKGKTNALRETEMNTFLLQQDKLHEEVQKLRLEGDVLRLKRNYYVIKLQVLMKEHPDIIDEVFGED
nr:obscurin-like [Crassostrea gigas]